LAPSPTRIAPSVNVILDVPPLVIGIGVERAMVIVFPTAEVEIKPLPKISRLLARGIAVPASDVNDVAICGCELSMSKSPACEIPHLP